MYSVRNALLTYGVHSRADRGGPGRYGRLDGDARGQQSGPRSTPTSARVLPQIAAPVQIGPSDHCVERPQPSAPAVRRDGQGHAEAHAGGTDGRPVLRGGRQPLNGSLAKRFCEHLSSDARCEAHECTHRPGTHRTKGPRPAVLNLPVAGALHRHGLSTKRRTPFRQLPLTGGVLRRPCRRRSPSTGLRALTTAGWNRMAFHGIWCERCSRALRRGDGFGPDSTFLPPGPGAARATRTPQQYAPEDRKPTFPMRTNAPPRGPAPPCPARGGPPTQVDGLPAPGHGPVDRPRAAPQRRGVGPTLPLWTAGPTGRSTAVTDLGALHALRTVRPETNPLYRVSRRSRQCTRLPRPSTSPTPNRGVRTIGDRPPANSRIDLRRRTTT